MSANKSKSISIGSNNTQGNTSVTTKGSKATTKGSKSTTKGSKSTTNSVLPKSKEPESIISVSANLDDEFGDTWDSPVQNVVVSSLPLEVAIAQTAGSFEDEFADSWNDTPVISTAGSNQLTTDEKDVVSTSMSDHNVTSSEEDNDLVDNSFNRAETGRILIEKLTKKGYNLFGISGEMIIEKWEDAEYSMAVHSLNRSHVSTVFSDVREYGFETPREIQMLSILSLLNGDDFIGQAPAGSGKTCAFGVPIVLRTDPRRKGIQAIILTPTGVLAEQHCDFLRKISKGTGIIVSTWIKGSVYPTRDNMPHIVVGTPGRVSELVTKTFFCKRTNRTKMSIDLSNLKSLVLDEADELLGQGFKTQTGSIIESCPMTTQTCLFSATMPVWMINSCKEFMKPECPNIIVPEKEVITIRVNQHYSKCRDEEGKLNDVVDCINKNPLSTIVVFCNTCSTIKKISESLATKGINHLCVNSKLTSEDRTKTLESFLSGKCRILLASDLIARGFDFTEISIVINYDMPNNVETYVHRIGRAGRAGDIGNAVTLITSEQEMATMKYIVQFHGMPIKETVTKSTKTKDGKSRVKFMFN
jgi:superfamily II DNA/RNA helicase